MNQAASGPGYLRRFVLPGLFVLALFVVHFLRRPDPADQQRSAVQVVQGMTMGTSFVVKIVGGTDVGHSEVEAAIAAELEAVNAEMSTYRADSALSRFNASPDTAPIDVPAAIVQVVSLAREISVASGGAFDVTVGPLVDAWGFGPTPREGAPSDAELTALGAHVGFQKLTIGDGTLTKADGRLRVDLSAIAKGHGVDRVAERLDAFGARRYMVEVGGEVRVRGDSNAGRPWRIGIEVPTLEQRRVGSVLEVREGAIATSGDYRNYREVDGRRVSHTIDPRTRRPITHTLASVTVIHETCAAADGWATALMVLGPDAGPKLATAQGLDALFIVREAGGFREVQTNGFADYRTKSPTP